MEGAKVLELCEEGDKLIEAGTAAVYNKGTKGVKIPKGTFAGYLYCVSHCTAGLAFPTSISVNNCVGHFTPLPCVACAFEPRS